MRVFVKTAKGFAITLTPTPLPLAGEGSRTPCQKTFADLLRNEYPIFAARPGALLRCSSFVWLATRHSSRLASHPAHTTLMGYSFLEIT